MSQLSNLAAFIVLTRDRHGGRVTIAKRGEPIVRYRVTGRDRDHMTTGIQEAARMHRAAGAKEIFTLHTIPPRFTEGDDWNMFLHEIEEKSVEPNEIALFSAHFMSSCTMGSDPNRSATNPQGELIGVRNLFVADTSIFPSSSGVNPMMTVMSMARRTTEYVSSRLRA
jgi:choline dehydrogenase-like flavoprotein